MVNRCTSNSMHSKVLHQIVSTITMIINSGFSGGCDLDVYSNTTWQTALFCAVDQTKTGFARSLLSHGADPQIEDKHGITLLHKACSRNMRSVVYVLIYGGLIDWQMESWLERDIHDSGINPNLIQDYPPNIPPVLLKNVDLFFDIMAVRSNVLTLASLTRRVIRCQMKSNLKNKVNKLVLPLRIKQYLLFKNEK